MKVNWIVLVGAATIALTALPWVDLSVARMPEIWSADINGGLLLAAILLGLMLLPRSLGRASAMLIVAILGGLFKAYIGFGISFGCAWGCAEPYRSAEEAYEVLCSASLGGTMLVIVGGIREIVQVTKTKAALAQTRSGGGSRQTTA
jgi:hypothetical protein